MRKRFDVQTTLPELLAKCEELVSQAAIMPLPSPGKAKYVAVELALWLDKRISYGPGPVGRFAEAIDQPLLRALMHLIVEFCYASMKNGGRI